MPCVENAVLQIERDSEQQRAHHDDHVAAVVRRAQSPRAELSAEEDHQQQNGDGECAQQQPRAAAQRGHGFVVLLFGGSRAQTHHACSYAHADKDAADQNEALQQTVVAVPSRLQHACKNA